MDSQFCWGLLLPAQVSSLALSPRSHTDTHITGRLTPQGFLLTQEGGPAPGASHLVGCLGGEMLGFPSQLGPPGLFSGPLRS